MKKIRHELDRIPNWYGYAYTSYGPDGIFHAYYPIPFNVFVLLFYKARQFFKIPFGINDCYATDASPEYERGYMDALAGRDIREMARKNLEKGLSFD